MYSLVPPTSAKTYSKTNTTKYKQGALEIVETPTQRETTSRYIPLSCFIKPDNANVPSICSQMTFPISKTIARILQGEHNHIFLANRCFQKLSTHAAAMQFENTGREISTYAFYFRLHFVFSEHTPKKTPRHPHTHDS